MKTLILILLLASNSALSQTWDYLVTTKSETSYFIDSASIAKDGVLVRFSQLINYPNGYDLKNLNIHSIQQVKKIDCLSGLIKTISMIGYDRENAVGKILTASVGREYEWIRINTNSVSGIYRERVCK